jgi:hypothetical protein
MIIGMARSLPWLVPKIGTSLRLNFAFALRQPLSGSPCRTYMSDMRLHVAQANSYSYPVILVTYSAQD